MNKRGDAAAIIFTIMTVIIFGAVLYSFNTSNNSIKTTVSGQNDLDKIYFSYDNFNFNVDQSEEQAFVDTYNYFLSDDKYMKNRIREDNYPVLQSLKDDLNEEFKNEFKRRFLVEIRKYSSINDNDVEFISNGKNFIVNIKNQAFESQNDQVSLKYSPVISKEFSYDTMGLNDFQEIYDSKKTCESLVYEEKTNCYKEKLYNFDVSVERKNSKGEFYVVILTSKESFLVNRESVDQNNEVLKISSIAKIQIIFREN